MEYETPEEGWFHDSLDSSLDQRFNQLRDDEIAEVEAWARQHALRLSALRRELQKEGFTRQEAVYMAMSINDRRGPSLT